MAAELHPTQPATEARHPGGMSAAALMEQPGVRSAPRLMDWRSFHSELQRAAVAATQTAAPLALLMMEITGPGAEIAAAPMAALTRVIEAAVGKSALLARYSEGRVAVILSGADLGEAIARAECIAHQLASPHDAAACPEASAAIGVAQFQDDESLGHLIQRVAAALGRARTDRRPTVVADSGARQRLRRPDLGADGGSPAAGLCRQ